MKEVPAVEELAGRARTKRGRKQPVEETRVLGAKLSLRK